MSAAVQNRRKKCRGCGEWFHPYNSLQKAAPGHIQCALSVSQADKAKRERKEARQQRQRLKTRSEWMSEAQDAFNAFVRLRDADKPCIDCGSYGPDDDWLTGGKWDAGHYLSVGSHPELRFNEDNCHKQLKTCNGGSGKYGRKRRTVAEGYREGLIARIGIERVEALEGPHEPKKYTIDELKEIKQLYRDKFKALRNKHDA